MAPVYQPVSGTRWLLSTKFRRWLFETQYLHIPCSFCLYQNAGVGAMICLYRIGVESTLCCMYIRQTCRICVESGLLDSCNPGLLLLGFERRNHKNNVFKVLSVWQLSGGVEHRNHGSTNGSPGPHSQESQYVNSTYGTL
jgi:hypothetical protein